MSPEKVLHKLLSIATKEDYCQLSASDDILEKINYVCRCVENRAGVRLLMACLLAKVCKPDVDPLKPYTEIGSNDCFPGGRMTKNISRILSMKTSCLAIPRRHF